MRESKKTNTDILRSLENQMKQIWSRYIQYLDANGFDERATSLRSEYFRLYRNYRKNKDWRKAINVISDEVTKGGVQ